MNEAPHVGITACYGGYLIQCQEWDEAGEFREPKYVCNTIDEVCRRVRIALEAMDRQNQESIEKALKARSAKKR